MIDVKRLRNDFEGIKQALANRGEQINEMDKFTSFDEKRRSLLVESETLKNKRNTVSEEIAQKKRNKEDAADLIAEMKLVSDQIKQFDEEVRQVEEELEQVLLAIPNIPHESVPIGLTEEENVPIRHWGEPPEFTFEVKPHWDVATI